MFRYIYIEGIAEYKLQNICLILRDFFTLKLFNLVCEWDRIKCMVCEWDGPVCEWDGFHFPNFESSY